MPLHGNIFGAASAKELIKPSKDSASLKSAMKTIFLVLDFL